METFLKNAGARLPDALGRQSAAFVARVFAAIALMSGSEKAFAAALPVEEPRQGYEADFESDIFPFLSDNCVACHCKTTKKAGLNLETPADILKGGESGPAAVPGKALESLLLKVSTHEDPDSAMPPRDNKVKAKNLNPTQLGLLKRWIEQGAKPGRVAVRELNWQPLPAHLRSILALDVSQDGRNVACSRGNQLFLYQTSTGSLLFRSEAHQDQVQAVAFSPDGGLLASGGFREIKLWRRQSTAPAKSATVLPNCLSVSESGALSAVSEGNGVRLRWSAKPGVEPLLWELPGAPVAAAISDDASKVAVLVSGKKLLLAASETAQTAVSVDLPLDSRLLAWSANAKSVYSGGGDAIVREWDALTGALVRERKGLPSEVVALSRSGSRLVAGCTDGSIWIWEGDAEQPQVKIKSPAAASVAAVSGDGSRIASAAPDGMVRIFDAGGKVLAAFKGDPIRQNDFERGQRRLEIQDAALVYRKESLAEAEKALTAAKDRLKKTQDSVPVKTKDLEAKQKAVSDLAPAIVAAEKAVADAVSALKAAAEAVKAAETGKAQSAEAAERLKADAASTPEAVAEGAKRAGDAQKALETAAAALKAKEAAQKVAADALDAALKKKTTAVADEEKAKAAKSLAENELQLSIKEEKDSVAGVEKAKGELAADEGLRNKLKLEVDGLRTLAETVVPVSALRIVEGSGLLCVGLANGMVQIRGTLTGGIVEIFGERRDKGAVRVFTAAGQVLSAVSEDGVSWNWNSAQSWTLAKTFGGVKTIAPLHDRVLALAFSPDGKTLAAGSGDPSREGDILLWKTDALDAEPRRISGVHSDMVLSLTFSPDGRLLVSGGADKVARIVDLQTLKVSRTLEGHTHHVLGVDWSPDGRSIVTAGGDNVLKIWDVATGVRKKNVDGADKEVTAVRYLGAGAQFAASSGDGKVRLIAKDGTAVKTMSENADFVNALAVPGNGSVIAVGGPDGIIRIWNPADGSKVTELRESK